MKLFNRIVGTTTLFILLFLMLIWWLSPLVSRTIIDGALESHGLKLEEKSSIRLNPFVSELVINDLSWSSDNDDVFRLDKLYLKYSFWRLLGFQVHVKTLSINGAQAHIDKRDRQLTIMGVDLPSASDDVPKETKETKSRFYDFKAKLDAVSIRAVELHIDIDGNAQHVLIDEIALTDISHRDGLLGGLIETKVSLNKGAVSRAGKLSISSGDAAGSTIPLVGFNLNASSSFQGDISDEVLLEISDTRLNIDEIVYQDDQNQADVGRLSVDVDEAELVLGDSAALSSTLSVFADDLSLRSEKDSSLATVEKVSLPTMYVGLAQKSLSVDADEIVLKASRLLLASNNSPSGLGKSVATLPEIRLGGVSFKRVSDSNEQRLSQSSLGDGQNIEVALSSVSINAAEVGLDVDGSTQDLLVNKFKLDDVSYKSGQIKGQIESHFEVNKKRISRINKPPIKPATPAGSANPLIGFDFDISSSFSGAINESVFLKLDDTLIDVVDIVYDDNQYRVDLGKLAFDFNETEFTLNDSVSLSSTLNLVADSVLLQHDKEVTLASVEKFNFTEISLDLVNDSISVDASEVILETSRFLLGDDDTSSKPKDDVAKVSKLRLDELSFINKPSTGDTLFTVAGVGLSDLYANLRINKDKRFELLSLLDAALARNGVSNEPSITGRGDNNSFKYQIEKLYLTSPAKIYVDDASVTPSFSKLLIVDELSVNNINTGNANSEADFILAVSDDAGFKASLKGEVKPFSDKLSLNVDSEVREFPINEVSPYIGNFLGFNVKAGQLDSNSNIVVTDDLLDGELNVELRGAKFSSADVESSDELDMVGQAAIPLNVALNMLKDRGGNISLSIPINGDINDPRFGLQSVLGLVIKKAVMRQARSHLINTFVPYGQLLSVAYSAGSFVLKVRVEDLTYEPQQLIISDEQAEFVKQFSDLLKQKSRLQVRVCPIATLAELNEAVSEPLSDEQRRQLIDIAKERGDIFKASATELGVDSSRLLICIPKIDLDDQSQPRIEFSI